MKDAVQTKTTRDAILDATDRLLARYGYKKMTIDDLAHEVGIGKGSIYLHFTSKEEIALSHIDRIIERLKERLHVLAAKDASIDERLCDMLIERVLFRFDSVQHYTESLNSLLAHIRPRLLERRKRYFREEAQIFAAVLKEEEGGGVFPGGHPFVLPQAVMREKIPLSPNTLGSADRGHQKESGDQKKKTATILIRGLSK